jgi:hypothetical protein
MTKDKFCLVRQGLLAVALTASLAACGSGETRDPPPDTDITDTSGSPEVEGTGPEPPRPPDDGKSLSYPNLPAGEADNYTDAPLRQCVLVKWLGQTAVPDGVSVPVRSTRITPGGVFDITGSSCRGVQGCTESFSFTSADESCSVSITATGADGKEAYLRLTGHCVSKNARQCDELLADDRSPISLHQPEPDEESPEDPTTDEVPTTDEQPTSEESPPLTTG